MSKGRTALKLVWTHCISYKNRRNTRLHTVGVGCSTRSGEGKANDIASDPLFSEMQWGHPFGSCALKAYEPL